MEGSSMTPAQRFMAATVSGVLVCLSFPTVLFGWHLPNMGWLGWIALVPLILAFRDASPRQAYFLTFVAGIFWFGGSLYWLYGAMHEYGHLPVFTTIILLIFLVMLQSSIVACAPMIARYIQDRWGGELIVWLPTSYVAIEFLRSAFPANGFPWSDLSLSQWAYLPLIQIVDLVGVSGLMFLLVWVNVLIAELVSRVRGQTVRQPVLKALMTLILLAGVVIYGYARLHLYDRIDGAADGLKVGLVQGNIPQEEKWAEGKAIENLNKLRRASRKLRDVAVDLIIWPESSLPWPFGTEAKQLDPRLFGLDKGTLGPRPYVLIGLLSERPDERFHNSAVLFNAQGDVLGRYHKSHLVPFGEYVPYAWLFSFAHKLTEPVGDFLPGKMLRPLVAEGIAVGPLVCYEDIFPDISRELVRSGARFLANITNDAWYGVSSAAWQHLALSVFRAVENRRDLVRATNTGVSAHITASGRVRQSSQLFEDALLITRVGMFRDITVYTRLGDFFAWGCVAYVLLGLLIATTLTLRRRRAIR